MLDEEITRHIENTYQLAYEAGALNVVESVRQAVDAIGPHLLITPEIINAFLNSLVTEIKESTIVND